MNEFVKKMFLALKPKGFVWRFKIGDSLDQLFDAFGSIWEEMRSFLAGLAFIRSPKKTPYLDELEDDFSVKKNNSLTISERRARLDVAKYQRNSDGDLDVLQSRLRVAGFSDIYVHENNPPVNPDTFIFSAFLAVCGNETSVCGNENAVCGGVFGRLIVNAEYFNYILSYLVVCNHEEAVCGNENAVSGRSLFEKEVIELFDVPAASGYWGLFFFVGGVATRDVGGELLTIAVYEVPISREEELINIILQYKPSHSWCGLRAEAV